MFLFSYESVFKFAFVFFFSHLFFKYFCFSLLRSLNVSVFLAWSLSKQSLVQSFLFISFSISFIFFPLSSFSSSLCFVVVCLFVFLFNFVLVHIDNVIYYTLLHNYQPTHDTVCPKVGMKQS